MSNLSISRLVSVSVNLSPKGAQMQNTSQLLILGSSSVVDVVQRIQTYASASDVLNDGFASNSPEYLAAVNWFNQVPQPTSVMIGRWAKTNTAGQMLTGTLSAAQQALAVWNAVTNGAFKITVDAGAQQSPANLNFSAATSLAQVASIIQAALTGCSVAWDSHSNVFMFTSATTGASSSVSFMSAPVAGTDLTPMMNGSQALGAYQANGMLAESALAAATLFDTNYGQQWYGLTIPEAVTADHQAVAAFIEGTSNKHVYGVTSQDPNVLVAGSTTDIAYLLKTAGYNKSIVQYSSASASAVASLLARILTTNYNANNSVITLMYKQEPGITSESLTLTQIQALEGKNCNVFVAYNNNTSIIEPGVMASGQYADVVMGTDWLALDIQTALYNLQYTSPTKIPQTDAGMNQYTAVIENEMAIAVRDGLLAPGTWTSNGFGGLNTGDFMPKGYYVYAPPVSTQSTAQRAARATPAIQIAAKMAGAFHTANVIINVNQ